MRFGAIIMITKVKEQKDPTIDEVVSYEMILSDGKISSVPKDEDNKDYQNILKWVAEGNTIEEAD